MYIERPDEHTTIVSLTDGSPKWEDFHEACREQFCKVFLEYAYKCFERPEVKADFEKWQEERKRKGTRIEAF